MIDYLSPLLEEEPGLDWQEPVWVPAADREEPGLPETVDSGKAGMEALHYAAAQAGVENLEGETGLTPDLSWAEPLEGRTVSSAVLAQRLRRTGRVSRLARGGGSTVTVVTFWASAAWRAWSNSSGAGSRSGIFTWMPL